MKHILRLESVVDLNAASTTTADTKKMVGAGVIYVDKIFGYFEEVVAAGGFSSTAPVASVELNGTEIATWTGVSPAVAISVGDKADFAVNTTNITNTSKTISFASGDTLTVKTKTQGAGGTVTGTIRVHVPLDTDIA